ncbi:MAG: copper resistance CopC/CopD family protein [Acidimicrobiales bacterium]
MATVSGAALLLAAAPASAHAQLESTSPTQSAVLLVSPPEVVLHFGEAVEIDFGSVRVLDPDGRRVDQDGAHHPAGDAHSVAVSLPRHLPAGTYVVAWRVISADSHPVQGGFVFSVGTAAGVRHGQSVAAALASAKGNTAIGVLYGMMRFVLFAALLVLVGLFAVFRAVRPGIAPASVLATLWAAWGVLLLVSLGSIAVQGVYAAQLPIGHLLSPSLFDEVVHTRFGEIQLARVALLVVGAPALLGLSSRSTSRAWVATAGAALVGAALLLTPGLAGHASTTGNGLVGELLDFLHLAAAAVWVGGLVLLGLAAVSRNPAGRPPLAELASRFSPLALAAALVVLSTGSLQSLREVGSRYALVHTAYGRILLVKVGLVVVLVLLGATTHRVLTGRWVPVTAGAHGPLDDTGSRRRGGRWALLAELALFGGVLASTAVLVDAAPGKQAAAAPFTQTLDVLGLQVNVIVDPARVGAGNQLHCYVLGRLGQPEAIPELDATIGLRSAGVAAVSVPLVVVGPGHYQATDVDFPLAGNWVLDLTVRTTAIDEQQVVAVVPVH